MNENKPVVTDCCICSQPVYELFHLCPACSEQLVNEYSKQPRWECSHWITSNGKIKANSIFGINIVYSPDGPVIPQMIKQNITTQARGNNE